MGPQPVNGTLKPLSQSQTVWSLAVAFLAALPDLAAQVLGTPEVASYLPPRVVGVLHLIVAVAAIYAVWRARLGGRQDAQGTNLAALQAANGSTEALVVNAQGAPQVQGAGEP